MRLIDADALIKSIKECVEAKDANCEWEQVQGLECALECIDEEPTVQPVVRWIPCSERLPEEKINPNTQNYDWVLCSTTFGDVRAYHFGRGRFLHGCGDVTQYVIAWMPLPEPYEGDDYAD